MLAKKVKQTQKKEQLIIRGTELGKERPVSSVRRGAIKLKFLF